MTYEFLHSLGIFLSYGAASFCVGCLLGVWIQKRRSHEETALLVNMWENMHRLNQDVDTLSEHLGSYDDRLEQQQRNYTWLHSEYLLIKRDVDGLDNTGDYEDDDEEITLELPVVELDTP